MIIYKYFFKFLFIIFILSGYIFYIQFSLFVIQPIGAIPNGQTFLTTKISDYYFIDSADAVCKRRIEKVSLLCRAVILGTVINSENIIYKLPYSEFLYKFTIDRD